MSISRRQFIQVSGAAAVASAAGVRSAHSARPTSRRVLPVVIASGNGLPGVQRAYDLIASEQTDPLDAAIEGVQIQELDPEDQSVGLGGLPDQDGVVTLDASVMHGPSRRAGSVAAMQDIATAAAVAKAVMEYTDHVMLVGEGARDFAVKMGFEPQDLLTDRSRRDWLIWRSRLNDNDDWLEWSDEATNHTTGTINMCAVDARGDIGSVTTTSGLAWKIPGRIGDSPIVGAGQYCDNTVGAAGATGRGEAAIKACGAFLVVEFMRGGMTPTEACLEALRRSVAQTEDRLLDDEGRPLYGLNYYAVHKDGRFGAATMYEGGQFAVANEDGARLEPMAYLYGDEERPEAD